ncbi:FHA domain-containing protein [Lentzea rhizosphaerae]|uniref:FHA domain-containing protein n=1 Tax=Lentzea rhizosphaerae TaxID=2041025 RepID=A0ABV8BT74_9PSEU
MPEERPNELPANHHSLALGVSASVVPGMLHVLAMTGGLAFGPKEGRTVLFGRSRPDVHVCVGEDDLRISREHGALTCSGGKWWISTLGRLPLRLPESRLLFRQDEPIPLQTGYTPLFVRGSHERLHLLEVHVQPEDRDRPPADHHAPTRPPRTWHLTAVEKRVIVVLAQRYLLHEQHPIPLSWRQVAQHLNEIRPDDNWNHKKVERVVTEVRNRLSGNGVPGLTREEVGEPIGNTLNHNLIRELMESTTLVPPDLRILDHDG